MIEERWLELQSVRLESGAHDPDSHYCVMELAAHVAGEPWSDHPQCVSPAIAAFMRSWNDALDDERRQILKPFVPQVIGTNTGAADEERRAWMATDWLVRKFAPAWLDLAGLSEHAANLRGLPALETSALASATIVTIRAARDAARDATWAAAGAAARDAAWDAAWDAARNAAGAAARDATWAAAAAAAGAAARDAAWDATWAAAGAAARDAAWNAAAAAAGAAAGDAARAAAGAPLAPTVVALQDSALDLLSRMIAVGQEASA